MLSIDEAIAHAREVAEKQRKDNDNCKYKSQCGCKGCADYYSKPCIECAEEHEQLAEWLEELKAYRAHIFSGDMTQAMLREERIRAIDEVIEKVKGIYAFTILEEKELGEIAEQLKAGEKHD